jgi:mono/diheme cytochrome c family protein
MSSRLMRLVVPVSACTFAAALAIHAQAQSPSRSARDGVYSGAQAGRGQALYKDKCASCHGPALSGANAPPLAGDAFLAVWDRCPSSSTRFSTRCRRTTRGS